MRRTDIHGLSIAYERAGDGPPLVLVHGLLADSRVFAPQLAALPREFDVLAWDAPGAGSSDDPEPPFGLADWADCLAALLEDLPPAHVLGQSWGGVLALELFRRRPDRVTSLILTDTSAGWRGSFSPQVCEERLASALREAGEPPDDVARRWVPTLLSPHADRSAVEHLLAMTREFHPAGYRLTAQAMAQADQRDLLPDIDVPTLLVWGEDDARSPLAIAEEFRETIPAARLVTLPRAGHLATLDQPAAFTAAVRDFLAF